MKDFDLLAFQRRVTADVRFIPRYGNWECFFNVGKGADLHTEVFTGRTPREALARAYQARGNRHD